MKIIIPMAGMGYRFIRANYSNPKPLIKIEGKPMIEHVVNMFPGETDILFICNSKHLVETPIRLILNQIAPTGRIIEIAPHKLGPVYTTLQASHFIEDEEPVIVNYCDFAVYWDYHNFKSEMRKRKCAGCVTAFRGFHPPHVPRNLYYAYLRENNGYMSEIKEKVSFTDNRAEEYASTGTYYFAKGRYVKEYFQKLMDREINTNGEYYVSLVYNLLVEDGLDVFIYEVENFLAWGTPEELEEYLYWSDYFINEASWEPRRKFGGQVLIPMAGAGARFSKEGYNTPKPLISVDGIPMVGAAAKSLPKANRYIFIYRKEHIKESDLKVTLDSHLGIDSTIIGIEKLTEGEVCTCLHACSVLDPEQPLLISACDNSMVWDEEKYTRLVEDVNNDCIVWTFRGYPGAIWNPQMYSWVEQEDGIVKRVSVKEPISDTPEQDAGITGAFWFRKARYFIEAANSLISSNERINREFHLDACINNLLNHGRKAVVFDVNRYICWGTPNELRTWEYWNDYFSKTRLRGI